MKGFVIALLELTLFFAGAATVREYVPELHVFNPFIYYWFCFTTLTGFWEFIYVTQYTKIARFAQSLVDKKDTVWTMDFPWWYICPVKISEIFYAEYAASADREYMSERRGDYWSRLIESSHAFCCGALCLASLVTTLVDPDKAFLIAMFSMGTQFMNSLLYMGQYLLQCKEKENPNYNCPAFPLGKWMCDRWFMWVNACWFLFPVIIGWMTF